MTLPERDHAMQTLVLNRAHEPFGIGIRVRRLKRRLHHTDTGRAQPLAYGCTPLGVSVTNEHAVAT